MFLVAVARRWERVRGDKAAGRDVADLIMDEERASWPFGALPRWQPQVAALHTSHATSRSWSDQNIPISLLAYGEAETRVYCWAGAGRSLFHS